MTKKEFEERTGITLSDEQFTPINWMYVNAGNMQKDEFCQEYMVHGRSKLLATIQACADSTGNELLNIKKKLNNLALFMIDQAHKSSSLEMRNKAVELLGLKKYLTTKLEKGYPLWSIDREDIISILNDK